MPNPLTSDTLRLTFLLKNPSAGSAVERPFKINDLYYEVTGPDGQRYDFGHTGVISVPVAGLTYDQKRQFPMAGGHQGRPVAIKLDNTVRSLALKPFTIAGFTTTREFHDDGSVYDVTTYTDGRAATQVMVAGPLDVDFGDSSLF